MNATSLLTVALVSFAFTVIVNLAVNSPAYVTVISVSEVVSGTSVLTEVVTSVSGTFTLLPLSYTATISIPVRSSLSPSV